MIVRESLHHKLAIKVARIKQGKMRVAMLERERGNVPGQGAVSAP